MADDREIIIGGHRERRLTLLINVIHTIIRRDSLSQIHSAAKTTYYILQLLVCVCTHTVGTLLLTSPVHASRT